MDDKYLILKSNDLLKSKVLARALHISREDFEKIQYWFDVLLIKHEEICNKEADQFRAEQELEKKFNELISSEIEKKSYKYVLAKLLHYNNVFNDNFLNSLYVARLGALLKGKLIPPLVNDKDLFYSPEDFLHTTVYLQENYFVSPNSNFLEDIIKIEQVRSIFKQATVEVKLATVKNILHIIQLKEFHHDIICFKKVLKLVTPKDVELIGYLKGFKVVNNQGCYNIINSLLNFAIDENTWNDFEIKVKLINFFDSARGANPAPSWSKKFEELSGTINNAVLLKVANTVLENESYKNYEFDNGGIWGDDTAKRFLKSAQWMQEIL